MGNDDDRLAIADLKARMNALERDVEDIKAEQSIARDRAQDSALHEKDLGKQIEMLSKDIQTHIDLHLRNENKRFRAVDIILAIGMLISAAFSAYGAMAMIAISKAIK